ncbi:MAG: ABC transporter ATP-binding protein [Actinomycetota bacterium]|jgi:putative ABC transport system ATP-binding protein
MKQAAARTVMRQAVLGQRRHLIPGTTLLVVHQVCESLVPIVIGAVIDQAIGTGDTGALLRWLAVLVALFAFLATAWFTNAVVTERACQGAEHDTRLRLVQRVLAPTGGVERRFKVGKLVSIANSDAEEVGRLGDHVPGAVGAAAAVVVAMAFLFAVDIRLGGLVLAGLPAVLAVEKFFADRLLDRWADEQEESSEAAAVATDLMAGLRVLKGLGAERAATDRYRRASRSSLQANLRSASVEALATTVSTVMTGGFLALVALVAGRMAVGGSVTVGEFVAAVGLTQFLITPLQTLGGGIAGLAESRASANRVAKVLDVPPGVADGWRRLDTDSVTGRLVLRGVSRGKLRGLDLTAGPGDLVGLAVPDPDVARELVACLARDADPDSGTLEVDGIPFEDLELDSLRRAVLVSAHDATLFEGPLADNVLPHGDGLPATIGLAAALEAAGAGQVVETLPAGAATDLGERGRRLSGGQSQRVALARALAADAPVLVLHEPTTAVDSVTEQQVAEGLRALRRDRTTLIITTSPALLAACTRVVFVGKKGSRVYGTHPLLLAEEAAYRRAVLA